MPELPVTVAELRNMLALCAYSLEVEASAWRDLARRRTSAKTQEKYANRARTLDKQAANVRRMLCAPMTAQGIETTIAEAARFDWPKRAGGGN